MNTIIACESIKPELENVKKRVDDVQILYLPQNLHRMPHKLKEALQEAIDKTGPEDGRIILGFGLCSNAVVGLKAPSQGLFIPRVHDCISFYLGSRERYMWLFNNYPGTYYLTVNWMEKKTDPLGLMENEYTERVGREMAEEAMQLEIKNYKYIGFINTTKESGKWLKRAKENASYFNKEFIEYRGKDQLFIKILFGPHDEPDFVYVKPDEKVKQNEFLK